MAYDKLVDSAQLDANLTIVADAIRDKGSTTANLEFPLGYKAAVEALPEPKPEQVKTATPSTSQQTITPDSGYTLSSVTVNAMPTATQATPSISVSSGGLITASATQTAGYVSAGTKSATSQLSTQAAKTITPSTSSQTAVASGKYTTGTVTVAAVPTQTKTVTPSASVQNITPDNGKFLSKVTVNAMPSEDLSAELAEYTALNAELEETVNVLVDVDDFYKILSREFSGDYTNPYMQKLGAYAFYRCYDLTTVTLPACTSVGTNAFSYCTNLTTVTLPACTSIDASAFSYCTNLTTVTLPACTSIGGHAFSSCYDLTTVTLPACTSIGGHAFSSCHDLTTVTLPACTSIGARAFEDCSYLTSIYLGASSVCSVNAEGLGIRNPASLTIYVPSSLYDAYMDDPYWSSIGASIVTM